MKTVVTTREYDDQGRLVKETVTEQSWTDQGSYQPSIGCTCPNNWCPVHSGGHNPHRIWCGVPSSPDTITINTVYPSTTTDTLRAFNRATRFASN